MRLARNPHFWKKDAAGIGLFYLDELEFQIIPDDATRLLKLKAGEIHGSEFVPYSRVRELQARKSLRMELWPSTRAAYLTLNVRPSYDGKPNPLSNQKVRQALSGRLVDLVVTFPFLVLVIAIVAVFGPGIINIYIAIIYVGWVAYARLMRAEVMVQKGSEYVAAARVLGYSALRIIFRTSCPMPCGRCSSMRSRTWRW